MSYEMRLNKGRAQRGEMSRKYQIMSHGSLLNFLPTTKHFNFVIVLQAKSTSSRHYKILG